MTTKIETSKDLERPEGAYVTIVPDRVLQELLDEKGFILIERVCGDATVKKIEFAPSEARSIFEQLNALGFGKHG